MERRICHRCQGTGEGAYYDEMRGYTLQIDCPVCLGRGQVTLHPLPLHEPKLKSYEAMDRAVAAFTRALRARPDRS